MCYHYLLPSTNTMMVNTECALTIGRELLPCWQRGGNDIGTGVWTVYPKEWLI
jgi:hypothetical protein